MQKLKFVLGRVENIEGKGENAGYQHFLLVPPCFHMLCLPGVLKGIVWLRVKTKLLVIGWSNNWETELNISMGECNTILSAYTMYRHLE